MILAHRWRLGGITFESLESRQLLIADLVISEFLAANNSTVVDQAGAFSDWIEIHNTTPGPGSANGWYLTNDSSNLTKWRFPNVSLAADGYLVVFASSKNRAIAGSELHTNFKLTASGAYLGLIDADGTTR